MDNLKLTKVIVSKNGKNYVNFYLDIGGAYVSIKPSFANDFHILNKIAKLHKKGE